jgi:hypothetical protein
MAETFNLSELVIPGTFIRVRAEGLISVGGISTGNIGIVGTAGEGLGDVTHLLSDYDGARDALGDYDEFDGGNGTLNLTRGVELAYKNGARIVYARALDPAEAGQDDYIAAFNELAKDDVNILIAPELPTSDALAVFGSVLETAENSGKDMMAVIGCDETTIAGIQGQVTTNDRIIMCTPGIVGFDAIAGAEVTLDGTYTAAAIAGLLSTLAPQSSPTNKILPGVVQLARRYSYGEMTALVGTRLMVLEQRGGIRVVRGLTTDDAAFTQVTTRRIVDFAKAGIRKASDPFIGKLNNQRVRAALRGAIDGFLTTMLQDEALIGYTLEVTATRQDEIAGRAMVNVVLQPTFSIDFVAVTMVLE